MSRPASSDVTSRLLEQRHIFKAFLTSRMASSADAEDLLQTSLLKALQRADEVHDSEKATAWFYRVLRNALIDHARSRAASVQRDDAWASIVDADPATHHHLCTCFEKLLPTLKPAQAELLRRVELAGEPVADAARALGLSTNNASVTLHRARAALRERLIALCGDCACLDNCECD